MTESNSPSPFEAKQQDLAEESNFTQVLSNLLVHRGVVGEETFGAVFWHSDLKVAYVNSIGRKILSPVYEGEGTSDDFQLRDIISLDSSRLFESKIFPFLELTNSWEGELVLRDLWGANIPIRATFWKESARFGDEDRKLVGFRGEPMLGQSFRAMRGWKDRELLLALLAHTEDRVYFKDRECRFIRLSSSLLKKFGLRFPHEAIGKTDFHFFKPSYASVAFEDEQEIIRTGKPIIAKEERELWDDGTESWASTTKLPLYSAKGEVVGTFGISRDITEQKRQELKRKELEEQLHTARRLESIGSLAAGVAHEINTPTQFVSDNMKFLEDAFGDFQKLLDAFLNLSEKSKGIQVLDKERELALSLAKECEIDFLREEIGDTIRQSMEGLRQIAQIVGSMKELSHPSPSEMVRADLNHAIQNALNVTRNQWKGVAKVDLDLDEDLPEVMCVLDELNQVFINLIVNAVQAIEETPDGCGILVVRTRSVEGGRVCIEVEDTGCGMPEEVSARIFEPFFTTKQVGKGTGQGLGLVRNFVVNSHKGDLEFESEVGSGTTFRVLLPLQAQGAEQSESIV